MDWSTLATSLLGSVVVAAIAGTIVKNLGDQRLDDIKLAHDRELETLKSELERTRSRESLRFTKLHERRLEWIEKLYEAILDAEQRLGTLYHPGRGKDPGEDKEAVDSAMEAIYEFDKRYRRSTLYF